MAPATSTQGARSRIRGRRSRARWCALPRRSGRSSPTESVGPGTAARKGEIVGVGHAVPFRLLGFSDLIGDAVALAIGDRFLFAVKAQPELALHITRTGPAHQRFDDAWLFRLIVEHPVLGLGLA